MIKCKIIYPDYGIIQYKNLISHDIYLSIIKPTQVEINRLEILLPSKKNKDYPKKSEEIKFLENIIKKYGEFFTDKSPIYKSKFNNNIMSLNGKMYEVIWEMQV